MTGSTPTFIEIRERPKELLVLNSLICCFTLEAQQELYQMPTTSLLLFFIVHTTLPFTAFSALVNSTCHDSCGTVAVKYPLGTGFGCGHPDFARYVRCNAGRLELSTGTGDYDITSIDYSSSSLMIGDELMSTCSSMHNSGSFSLDHASPFALTGENIFVLLGCSTTSPVFDPDEDLCDTGSRSRICKGLYSCQGVTGIGFSPQSAPISTCCVYQSPIQLSGYLLDLPKMQCSSYSSIYSFGGNERDPTKWKFGVSLQYNGSYYTDSCRECESSGGFCGFSGLDRSFVCICGNGKNSTNNCIGRGYSLSGTWKLQIRTNFGFGGLIVWWVVVVSCMI